MESTPAIAHTRHRMSRTRDLVAAALLAALLSASAYLVIPLGSVPITLQVFFVVLAALLLSPGWAASAVGVYVALGAAGAPVFAGGRGGLGVIAGPTGGYLLGFVVAAGVGALVRFALTRVGTRPLLADYVAAGIVIAVVYSVGTVQLAIVADLGPAQAILAGVVPFLIPDVIKAGIAAGVAQAISRARR